VRPGGRIVLTAWPERDSVVNAEGLLRRAVLEVTGRPDESGPDWTLWADRASLERLFAPAPVTVEEARLTLAAPSAEAFADAYFDHQPMWVGSRDVVGPERYEELRRESAAYYARVNEAAPGEGWRATTPYLLVTVRP